MSRAEEEEAEEDRDPVEREEMLRRESKQRKAEVDAENMLKKIAEVERDNMCEAMWTMSLVHRKSITAAMEKTRNWGRRKAQWERERASAEAAELGASSSVLAPASEGAAMPGCRWGEPTGRRSPGLREASARRAASCSLPALQQTATSFVAEPRGTSSVGVEPVSKKARGQWGVARSSSGGGGSHLGGGDGGLASPGGLGKRKKSSTSGGSGGGRSLSFSFKGKKKTAIGGRNSRPGPPLHPLPPVMAQAAALIDAGDEGEQQQQLEESGGFFGGPASFDAGVTAMDVEGLPPSLSSAGDSNGDGAIVAVAASPVIGDADRDHGGGSGAAAGKSNDSLAKERVDGLGENCNGYPQKQKENKTHQGIAATTATTATTTAAAATAAASPHRGAAALLPNISIGSSRVNVSCSGPLLASDGSAEGVGLERAVWSDPRLVQMRWNRGLVMVRATIEDAAGGQGLPAVSLTQSPSKLVVEALGAKVTIASRPGLTSGDGFAAACSDNGANSVRELRRFLRKLDCHVEEHARGGDEGLSVVENLQEKRLILSQVGSILEEEDYRYLLALGGVWLAVFHHPKVGRNPSRGWVTGSATPKLEVRVLMRRACLADEGGVVAEEDPAYAKAAREAVATAAASTVTLTMASSAATAAAAAAQQVPSLSKDEKDSVKTAIEGAARRGGGGGEGRGIMETAHDYFSALEDQIHDCKVREVVSGAVDGVVQAVMLNEGEGADLRDVVMWRAEESKRLRLLDRGFGKPFTRPFSLMGDSDED